MAIDDSWRPPPTWRALGSALRRRCPVCGERGISRHAAQVHDQCPNCGLDLERQVGSFIGGVGLNTIVSLGALLLVIVVGFVRANGDATVMGTLLPALVVAVVLPFALYARSRLVWVALELRFWPLSVDESADVADRLGVSQTGGESRPS